MTPIILLALVALALPAPAPIVVASAAVASGSGRTVQDPDPAKVDEGRQLFEKNKCLLCHKLDGKGGTLSVPLDGVADRLDAEAIDRVLLDPETALKDSKAKVKMPRFPLTDDEIAALVAYLRTLELNRGSAPDPGSA